MHFLVGLVELRRIDWKRPKLSFGAGVPGSPMYEVVIAATFFDKKKNGQRTRLPDFLIFRG